MSRKSELNPFELILEDINNGDEDSTFVGTKSAPPQFNFGKMLKSNDGRREPRKPASGYVLVFNSEGKGLVRGVLRNVSLGGLGIEIQSVDIANKSKIFVELSGIGAEFGRIPCEVCWVENVNPDPKSNKLVGLKFENPTTSFETKFKVFMKNLVQKAKTNPI